MSESIGFVLAAGAITGANIYVFNQRPVDEDAWRLVTATGIGALLFAGMESVVGSQFVRPLGILMLAAVILAPVKKGVPSPAESALKWYGK
jgi:hypothetical protein